MDTPAPTRKEIEAFITSEALALGLDPALHKAQCFVESSYRIDAYNKATDCYGLFQLSPICVKDLAQRLGVQVDRMQWRQNVIGGLAYMRSLLRQFHNDRLKSLAAFNWGSGNLNKTIKQHGDNWRQHLPKETALYLEKILALCSPQPQSQS